LVGWLVGEWLLLVAVVVVDRELSSHLKKLAILLDGSLCAVQLQLHLGNLLVVLRLDFVGCGLVRDGGHSLA
jgi:hypothetical protein